MCICKKNCIYCLVIQVTITSPILICEALPQKDKTKEKQKKI